MMKTRQRRYLRWWDKIEFEASMKKFKTILAVKSYLRNNLKPDTFSLPKSSVLVKEQPVDVGSFPGGEKTNSSH